MLICNCVRFDFVGQDRLGLSGRDGVAIDARPDSPLPSDGDAFEDLLVIVGGGYTATGAVG
jgi:hypothetical protein